MAGGSATPEQTSTKCVSWEDYHEEAQGPPASVHGSPQRTQDRSGYYRWRDARISAYPRAQSDKIVIGHLTPLTGFLGALGAYAVLGIQMAAEEINAAGGLHGPPASVDVGGQINPGYRLDEGAEDAGA